MMTAEEKGGGRSKKTKPNPKLDSNIGEKVHLKRQLGAFTCSFCGEKGYTRRGCKKKRVVDAAVTVVVAKNKKMKGDKHILQPPVNAPASFDAELVEIDLSQSTASKLEDSQQVGRHVRPQIFSITNLWSS
ncbi:hypothetical protein AHAS_Ahas02G0176500 [Arachis hypogaea]